MALITLPTGQNRIISRVTKSIHQAANAITLPEIK
jgi:hypothetical protein